METGSEIFASDSELEDTVVSSIKGERQEGQFEITLVRPEGIRDRILNRSEGPSTIQESYHTFRQIKQSFWQILSKQNIMAVSLHDSQSSQSSFSPF